MDVARSGGGRRAGRLTAGIAGLLAAAAAVAVLGHAGTFSRLAAPAAPASPLAGATVEPDPADAAPVVTSLRSDGQAARRGVRVGDRIAEVDGQPVADMAALRAAVARHAGPVPVSVGIHRGRATWAVALDPADPVLDQP